MSGKSFWPRVLLIEEKNIAYYNEQIEAMNKLVVLIKPEYDLCFEKMEKLLKEKDRIINAYESPSGFVPLVLKQQKKNDFDTNMKSIKSRIDALQPAMNKANENYIPIRDLIFSYEKLVQTSEKEIVLANEMIQEELEYLRNKHLMYAACPARYY